MSGFLLAGALNGAPKFLDCGGAYVASCALRNGCSGSTGVGSAGATDTFAGGCGVGNIAGSLDLSRLVVGSTGIGGGTGQSVSSSSISVEVLRAFFCPQVRIVRMNPGQRAFKVKSSASSNAMRSVADS